MCILFSNVGYEFENIKEFKMLGNVERKTLGNSSIRKKNFEKIFSFLICV